MADPALLNRLVREIQSMPEFAGCVVGYQGCYGAGGPLSKILYDGDVPSINYSRVAIVIEELEVEDSTTNADTERWAKAGQSPPNVANPKVVENKSKLGSELLGAGLTCGLTVVAAAGVIGSAAAEVPSGGTSTFVLVASWTGMITSGLECANSLFRLGIIAGDPEGSQLQALDSNQVYQVTALIVDALNIASGIASLPSGAKSLGTLLKQRAAAKGFTEETLKTMSRGERAKVISELMDDVKRESGGMDRIIAASGEVGVGRATLQRIQGGSLSVRNATRMASVIADETVKRLNRNLLSVLSTPIGMAGSASPSDVVGGAASGSMNYIINLVDATTSN